MRKVVTDKPPDTEGRKVSRVKASEVKVERIFSKSYLLQPQDPFGVRFPEEFEGNTTIYDARKTQGFIASVYGMKTVNQITDSLSPRTANLVFAFLDARRERMRTIWDYRNQRIETLYDD